MINPFRYGNPVPPEGFVGRTDVLQKVFSRIHKAESTAVIGDPHMGKSSLLRYIADPQKQSEFECDPARLIFNALDAHMLGEHSVPADFWLDLAEPLTQACPEAEIARAVTRMRESACRANSVIALFNALASRNRVAVVTIDEFDSLLRQPAFCTVEFFGLLRSVSTRTGGIAVVAASRLSVSELIRRTEAICPVGSPLFNNLIEVRLRPLALREVDQLLVATLAGTGVVFSESDRDFIVSLSGRHPFLVQLAAAALFDEKAAGGDPDAVYKRAAQTVHEESRAYFDDLWRHLDPKAQVALVIVALSDAGQRQNGRDFDVGDTDSMEWFEPELNRLAESGLVISRASDGQDRRWSPGVAAFVPWLIEDVIPGSRESLDFNNWLREREYDGLLTRKQRNRIRNVADTVPKGLIAWIGGLVTEVVKGLMKSKP